MEASGGAVGTGSVASCPRRDRTLPNTAFQNRRSKQHLRVEGEWANSYEAQQHRQHIEPISDYPVCWTLTGYASGYSSAYSVARSSTTKKNAWERETSAVLSLATLQMTKPRKSEIS